MTLDLVAAALLAEREAASAIAAYDAIVLGAGPDGWKPSKIRAHADDLAAAAAIACEAAYAANAALGKDLQWYRDDAAFFRTQCTPIGPSA